MCRLACVGLGLCKKIRTVGRVLRELCFVWRNVFKKEQGSSQCKGDMEYVVLIGLFGVLGCTGGFVVRFCTCVFRLRWVQHECQSTHTALNRSILSCSLFLVWSSLAFEGGVCEWKTHSIRVAS